MKLTTKAVAVLVLIFALSKIAYVWTALDPFFDSRVWQRLYATLATWFNVDGLEQGDNLVMAVILCMSFALSLLAVSVLSHYFFRKTRNTSAR